MELCGYADTSCPTCGNSYTDSIGGTDGPPGAYSHISTNNYSYRRAEFNTGSHSDTDRGTHIHARDVSYVDTFGYASGGDTDLYDYTGSHANTSGG